MSTNTVAEHHDHHHDHQVEADKTAVFGFWIYIMSDCILFSCLFATFAVMHNNTFGGPGIKQLSSLPYVLAETIFLLASSFTYGLATLNMYKDRMRNVMFWMGVTFLLGLAFVGMEVNEFVHLILDGHGPQSSGALSAFFTLVGTHGFHVSIGLFWMLILMFQLTFFKLSPAMRRRIVYLGLFWAFLDIVWIFVFTIVYLMGMV